MRAFGLGALILILFGAFYLWQQQKNPHSEAPLVLVPWKDQCIELSVPKDWQQKTWRDDYIAFVGSTAAHGEEKTEDRVRIVFNQRNNDALGYANGGGSHYATDSFKVPLDHYFSLIVEHEYDIDSGNHQEKEATESIRNFAIAVAKTYKRNPACQTE
jgi:hypothetical protein